MTSKPLVAGVGMTRFYKPSQSPTWDALGAAAVRAALTDAGLDYCDVQQAYAGYVFANTTSAQTTLYQVGLTGIPIVSVNNACASGSTALYLARQAVESGAVDVALALGFDQMPSGAIAAPNHIPAAHADLMADARLSLQPTDPDAPIAAQLFGGAGREYQQLYGTDAATFAQLQVKARRHAANNPLALFTAPLTVDEILQSPPLYGPLTRLQACPPTCGAAAALIVSPALARRRGLTGLIEIVAQTMTSDTPDAVEHPSMIDIVGADMTRRAADKVYELAGVGPSAAQVVELHDCFTTAEAIFAEALGLCGAGEIAQMVADGDNTYGGQYVVNPSGGLLSKGHPLGATGLAQCYELVQQLRGNADKRQVEHATHALQHNAGLVGACVVTMYRRA